MVNSYRTCQRCKKIYTYMGNPLCPSCVKQLDEDFQKIKKYLYENPGAGVEEVSEKTEVEVKTVLHFLREGRLEMKNADGMLLCTKCGVPITKGTMCPACMSGMVRTLESTLPKPEPKKQHSRLDAMSAKSKLHVEINKDQK
ncbi:MAG TPA: hypothetical protein DEB31_06990 [Clostridiales bacterium]|nr:hypothetical protein [Clostridiales bacterium]